MCLVRLLRPLFCLSGSRPDPAAWVPRPSKPSSPSRTRVRASPVGHGMCVSVMRGASLLCGNAEGLWHNAGEAIGQRGPDARVQKEPAHLASHHPLKTRATVSGSCQCAAASASTSQKQHMRGVCMGRAECRGHIHAMRCIACVGRAQAPRARASRWGGVSEIYRSLRSAAPLGEQRCQIWAISLWGGL